MKNKFKSYSFWMSVTGAVILVLNNLGKAFGFSVDSEIITQIVDSVCGVLILFGIITMSKSTENEKDENKDENFDKNLTNESKIDEKSSTNNSKQNTDNIENK